MIGKILGINGRAKTVQSPAVKLPHVFHMTCDVLFRHAFKTAPIKKYIPLGIIPVEIADLRAGFAQLEALGFNCQRYVGEENVLIISRDQFLERAVSMGYRLPKDELPSAEACKQALVRMLRRLKISAQQTGETVSQVMVGGKIVEAAIYQADEDTLVRLGINPHLLYMYHDRITAGPQVQVIADEDFANAAIFSGKNPGFYNGTYSPEGFRYMYEVVDGRIEEMAKKHRHARVPESCSPRTLTHEILHDLFVILPPEIRAGFVELVLGSVKQAEKGSPNAAFYYAIAARTGNGNFNLDQEMKKEAISCMLWLFTMEVFCYGGTQAIGYPEEGALPMPQELNQWFHQWMVDPNFKRPE